MRTSLLASLLGLVIAIARASEAPDPRIGTWKEVPGASPTYQSIQRTFEPLGDGRLRMIVNSKLDEANRWHVDFRCGQGRYPVLDARDQPVGQTFSCARLGPRSFEIVFIRRVPGSRDVRTRALETVSEDGERYTVHAFGRGPDGRERIIDREFARVR